MIGDLLAEPFLLGNIRETLKGIRDLERTVGRLTQIGGNARDLHVLRTSLEQIPQLREDLAALLRKEGGALLPESSLPHSLAALLIPQLHPLPQIVELLARALVELGTDAAARGRLGAAGPLPGGPVSGQPLISVQALIHSENGTQASPEPSRHFLRGVAQKWSASANASPATRRAISISSSLSAASPTRTISPPR